MNEKLLKFSAKPGVVAYQGWGGRSETQGQPQAWRQSRLPDPISKNRRQLVFVKIPIWSLKTAPQHGNPFLRVRTWVQPPRPTTKPAADVVRAILYPGTCYPSSLAYLLSSKPVKNLGSKKYKVGSESTGCSPRGPKFNTQQPYGGSQPPMSSAALSWRAGIYAITGKLLTLWLLAALSGLVSQGRCW